VQRQDVTSPRLRRRHERLFEVAFLLGLASLFLVNALVAAVEPEDFTSLVGDSSLARGLGLDDASWVATAIGVNDLTLGIASLGAIRYRRIRPALLAWSGGWLFTVAVIKLSSLGA
jgi:hypothetical protein